MGRERRKKKERGAPTKVCSYLELNDDVNLSKLSVMDSIRSLLQQWLKDDTLELKQAQVVDSQLITLRQDLEEFCSEALRPLVLGKYTSVDIAIPSVFEAVLEDYLLSDSIQKYYTVAYSIRSDIPAGINYMVPVRFIVKDTVRGLSIPKPRVLPRPKGGIRREEVHV